LGPSTKAGEKWISTRYKSILTLFSKWLIQSRRNFAIDGCISRIYRYTESVEFSLRSEKSYSCRAKASGNTFCLSLGIATTFFWGLSARSWTIAVEICNNMSMCVHDAGERAYTAMLFVCLPTNIEISSLTFNITGANATHVCIYIYIQIYTPTRTYARIHVRHEYMKCIVSLCLFASSPNSG